MTFSIVAVDTEEEEIGFAIASCTWNAGSVGTAKAELGAICSQAQGYYPFHRIFYESLQENMSLERIFEEFKKVDKDIEHRQVGMVSYSGETLAFTGENTDDWAGHRLGKNYACQGNILTGPDVLENMSRAFEESKGPLVERLYAALQAGDDAGGDLRGKMSARVLVKKKGSGMDDTYFDFNIEDHDEPVREIGRLLRVLRKIYNAYLKQNAVDKAETKDAKIRALEDMDEYLSDKVDRTVVDYHSFVASTSVELGLHERAVAAYKRVLKISPKLANFIRREGEKGKIPADVLDAIFET
jgi:uncharacterized Ntn-hydrolase superfamily protein